MVSNITNSCLVNVGPIRIQLICPSAKYAAALKEYFRVSAEDGTPDIELTFSITATAGPEIIPDSLFKAKQVSQKEIDIADGLIRGYFDPETGKGNLAVHYLLTSSHRTKVFEQLLFQAFYSACKRKNYAALLVHACGIIKDRLGYLFVGPSGSGKTTIANLSKDFLVANDEITLLEIVDDTVILHSTPFSGYFNHKKEGAAPLKAIIFLKQALQHKFYPSKTGHNSQHFFKEIVPPIGLEDELRTLTYIKMLDKAIPILERVPVFTLEFRKDAGFWTEIERVSG